MKTVWSHLPNATHIDRILLSFRAHTSVWISQELSSESPYSTTYEKHEIFLAKLEANSLAWSSLKSSKRKHKAAIAISDEAFTVALDNAKYSGCALGTAFVRAKPMAQTAEGASVALIAWDHSANFLDMTSNELKMWWVLGKDPAALLLLPAVRAFEQIAELELV